MRILDAQQTEQALPYSLLVMAVAQAAQQMVQGGIEAPERQVVQMGDGNVLLSMPAIGTDIGATKLITVHGNNAQHGLPAIQGEVIVFERATGRRLALLDGPTVTARRTAAVTLLGIQQLAKAPPASALLIGTGAQARAHAQALQDFFGIADFRIASRTVAHAAAFCERLQQDLNVSAQPLAMLDLPAQCEKVPLVIALTTATEPVIPEQLPEDTLAIGVGAFKREMAELPGELVRTRQVVVDHLAGAKHEAGDLMRARIAWSQVRDLADVLAGKVDKSGATPVLKTVGHAAWDLAAARVAIRAL